MPLNIFKPARSDKTLPLERSTGSFRIRKTINWEVDLAGLISGGEKTGSWEIEFTSPAGVVLFRQKVELKLFLVAIGVPGLQLFTWNYVHDRFETTIAGGEAVTHDTIGKYLLGGTLESQQGDLQPAEGFESTDQTATIVADWYSPVYVFRIPVGTTVKTRRDGWGFGSAVSTYAYAFEGGAPSHLIDTRFDGIGAQMCARGRRENGVVQSGRSWPQHRVLESEGWVRGSNPTIIELPDGRQIMAVLDETGYREFVSLDSGFTWQPMLYPDSQKGYGKVEKVLWEGGVQMPTMIEYEDVRLTIAVVGNELRSRSVGKEGPVDVVTVGQAKDAESYSLSSDSKGNIFITDTSGLPVFRSPGLPPRWQKMEVEGGEAT